MKHLKRMFNLSLALVLVLALALPVHAASDYSGNQLSGDWGNGSNVVLKGVTAQRKVNDQDLNTCYDVMVGGSLVLDMEFPAGHNRYYSMRIAGVIDTGNGQYRDWDLPAGKRINNYYEEEDNINQIVYTFSEEEMGQINGIDKWVYVETHWGDDYAEEEYWVGFFVRVVPASNQSGFSDVPDSSFCAKPVAWAVEKGITTGTGNGQFSPDATCSQAQILTFLWRANGQPAPTGAVNGSQYYAAAAQWAQQQSLTDDFSAEAPCTRAMVVSYLWRLAGSPAAETAQFSDVAAGSDYAQAVAWAVEKGITNGTGNGQFSPEATCTRGQIATFLYRALGE